MYALFHDGDTVEITYERDGNRYTTDLTPAYNEESGGYQYGISSVQGYTKLGPGETLAYGVYQVKFWIQYTIRSLEMLVTNQVSFNDLSGPVGIVKTIGDAYEQSLADGYFYVFLNMLNLGILLSANLGVMNLLPIPALDGGRLVFIILEMLRGKPVDPEKEGMVHMAGMAALMTLMLFVLFNDIRNLM